MPVCTDPFLPPKSISPEGGFLFHRRLTAGGGGTSDVSGSGSSPFTNNPAEEKPGHGPTFLGALLQAG